MNTLAVISTALCTGCGWCLPACAYHAIDLTTLLPNGFGKKTARINMTHCNGCGSCSTACPHEAIAITIISTP